METNRITVSATVNVPVETAWKLWTSPEAITEWCSPSPDWHAPAATSDLRDGGSFSTTMAARDGSMSFDFNGVYDKVVTNSEISYTIADGRKVDIRFEDQSGKTRIIETFDPEDQNPHDMQRGGWQAIMDSFKAYAEKQ